MLKKLSWLLCVCALSVWAQDDEFSEDFSAATETVEETTVDGAVGEGAAEETSAISEEEAMDARARDRAERKKFEEEQRADEFANSLRRRDWLKDRLVLELGMGSRMPVMGETGMGMGFGAGLEYITRWHLGVFGSFGLIPSGTDADFEQISLEGGFAWKAGLTYYLFPKNPLHLGFSVTYGTVYYDHDVKATEENDFTRELIAVDGYQFDVLVTYLTDSWYYLQFAIGMYYAPDAKDKSFGYATSEATEKTSRVVDKDGISKMGLVFGITVGFSFPEFFPDDTEKRRREREKARNAK